MIDGLVFLTFCIGWEGILKSKALHCIANGVLKGSILRRLLLFAYL